MAKTAYTITLTETRKRNYPNACRVIEEMCGNITDLLLSSLENSIKQYELQDKDGKYIEWALAGISLGIITKEGGIGNDG